MKTPGPARTCRFSPSEYDLLRCGGYLGNGMCGEAKKCCKKYKKGKKPCKSCPKH